MRWDDLFGDLEAQLAAAERAELLAELPDRVRRERATISLSERLHAHSGQNVALAFEFVDGTAVRGRLIDTGPDWLLLTDERERSVLISVATLASVSGLVRGVQTLGAVSRKFSLAMALRVIARDRAVVNLALAGGAVVTGTIDVVGSDYIELAEHPADLPRRTENLKGVRTIPLAALISATRRR